jgi:hypothetical protein
MARRNGVTRRERERLTELLSAYLDGQLADSERARLEERLAADASLRAELESLRQTVSLLGELPKVAVPRNFILPRATVTATRTVQRSSARRPLLAPVLTAATSLATLLFGVVLTGELVLTGLGGYATLSEPGGADSAPLSAPAAQTDTPTPAAVGSHQDALPPSPTVEAAPTIVAAGDGNGEDDQGERYSMDSPTPSPEPGLGGGGAPVSDTLQAPTGVLGGGEGEEAATSTPAAVGEEAAEPVAVQDEGALERAREPNGPAAIAPLWAWRAAETGLGLAALALGAAAVFAWRARRR